MKHTQATHVQTWTLCVRSFFSFWAMMLARSAIAQTPCCHDPVFIEGSPQPVSGAYFASDVGINGDGNLAILGEIFGDDSPLGAGTARIYSQVSGAWSEIQTIQHPLPAANDGFGASVDMSGNFAVIAAPNDADELGVLYVFERDLLLGTGQQWVYHSEIVNPANIPSIDDEFGGSLGQHETVAIDGHIAAIGAYGADVDQVSGAGVVYIFVYDRLQDSWLHEWSLTAPMPQASGGFGYSIELSGSKIIIGAPYHDTSQTDAGGAFVFMRTVTGTAQWSHEDTLEGSVAYGHFGWSVSIDGNYAMVGEPTSTGGSARIYRHNPATQAWQQEGDTLTKPGGAENLDSFGAAVRIDGTLAIVGAPGIDPDGIAYLYQKVANGWTLSQVLESTGEDTAGNDRLGETLALEGDEAFIGALGDEDQAYFPDLAQIGSALVFSDLPSCEGTCP